MPEPTAADPALPALGRPARWLGVSLGLLLLLLALRLGHLQVLEHARLSARAERQAFRESVLPPRRGEIQDRSGRPLAVTLMVPSVYADPRTLAREYGPWRGEIAQRLDRTLGLDPRKVLQELGKDRSFVWIKRQVTDAQWARLKAQRLPGVGMRPEPRRFYPQGALAGPLLGGTGVDGQPLAALELSYQGLLAGTPGHSRLTRDARGRVLLEDADDTLEPVDGATVVTTLDTGVQEVVERALDGLLSRCGCKGAIAIAMDPSTGGILAMASRPGYDPNRPSAVRPEQLQNLATLLVYEPGSTFKPFIVGPALAEGVVRADERIFCHNGSWKVRGRRKPLHDYHPHGWLTVTEVVAQSSNIGAAQIGQRMGMPRIHEELKRFGFGTRTGIDLPGEQAGILNPPSKWTGASIYSVPMGHEIAVTPIQLLAAFNVFANGGLWVRPHLLKEILGQDGTPVKAWEGPAPRRVLPASIVQGPVLEMLKAVVDHGTAKGAQPRGIRSAGKTGTAQKIGRDGQYLHDAWVSSYVCFAPAEKPLLTVLVVVDEPHNRKGGYTGGAVAAPVAKEILEGALGLLERAAPASTVASARP